MELQYFFRIETEREKFAKLNSILALKPNREDIFWEYDMNKENIQNSVNDFVNLIKSKKEAFSELAIKTNNISFWIFYEYENQCNLELNSKILKILGDNDIDLCISCWQ